MKKYVFGVIVVFLCLPVLLNHSSEKKTETKPKFPLYTNAFPDKHILEKARQTPVSSNLVPVLIYEVYQGKIRFGASGGCYTNLQGNPSIRLLTMAHVFFERKEPVSFLLRRISPVEEKASWCVSKILVIGKDWGEELDLAECLVVPVTNSVSLPLIRCSYRTEKSVIGTAYTFEQLNAGNKKIPRKTVTSLVTGERFMPCGLVLEPNRGGVYYIIDTPLIPGESGTCFFDDDGALYFGEGGTAFEVPPEQRKAFKLTSDLPGLVLGPLPMRKR